MEGSEEPQMKKSIDLGNNYTDYNFRSTSVLEILRECVRILRFNSAGFMTITALLICPVSAIQLSNLLVDHTVVRRLSIRLLLIARTTGLPLNPFIKLFCQRFSEMSVSIAVCFPFYATFSLLSKAAIVFSVDCTYCKHQFDASKFSAVAKKLWKRVIMTYIWACMTIVAIVTLFLVLLGVVCHVFSILGFAMDLIMYPGIVLGFLFSVLFANAIVICNVSVVTSVLEDVSGLQALLRSKDVIRGHTQVGLMIYIMSTLGLGFVQGLFEHRVKTLSYGDGSSRIWEGPLLVLMYSFVVLVDSMMTAVFYFSCRSFGMDADDEEDQPILEMVIEDCNAASDHCETDTA